MAKGPASRQGGCWDARRLSPVNTDESELALFRAERRVREIQAKLHRWGRPRPTAGLVERPLPGNGHGGCGRRLGETHRWKHRQGAPGRPHPMRWFRRWRYLPSYRRSSGVAVVAGVAACAVACAVVSERGEHDRSVSVPWAMSEPVTLSDGEELAPASTWFRGERQRGPGATPRNPGKRFSPPPPPVSPTIIGNPGPAEPVRPDPLRPFARTLIATDQLVITPLTKTR